MSIETNSRPYQRIGDLHGLKLLLAVMKWELVHLWVSREIWMLMGAGFVCSFGLLLVRNSWGAAPLLVLGTTALGQLAELTYDLMLVFGLILPFLVTDIVAHDFHQRVHELVMTTAVPNWAYVWGHYLSSLVVSLGLAIVMLISQLVMNLALPVMDKTYPPPALSATFIFWFVIAVPAALIVGSLCFSFGVLFPRFTVITKLVMCAGWVILALDLDPYEVGQRAYWNPTGAGLITVVSHQFLIQAQNNIRSMGNMIKQTQIVLQMQQQMPDLHPWIGNFILLASLSIFLAVFSAAGFRRFRDVLQ